MATRSSRAPAATRSSSRAATASPRSRVTAVSSRGGEPRQHHQPPVTSQWPGAGPFPATGRAPGVAAGLLAVAAGLTLLTGTIWQVVRLGRFLPVVIENFPFQLALGLQGLATVLLVAGGALLCLRVAPGRFLLLGGTVLLLVQLVLTLAEVTGFVCAPAVFQEAGVQDVALLAILLSLGSSLLGLLPSTAGWVSTLRT